jgi:hypothetical protein
VVTKITRVVFIQREISATKSFASEAPKEFRQTRGPTPGLLSAHLVPISTFYQVQLRGLYKQLKPLLDSLLLSANGGS